MCVYIDELTREVISYEMTTSVKFCLLYDPLKWYFIVFKMNIILERNRIVVSTLSMALRLRAKLL